MTKIDTSKFPLPEPEPPRQGVLTFKPVENDVNTLEAQSQRVFMPRGLMLWDVGTANLDLILIGTDAQLICSWGPIPARWFTVAQSFEAVARAVAEGKEPPGWGSWREVYCGSIVRLRFDRPAHRASTGEGFQALMWGLYH